MTPEQAVDHWMTCQHPKFLLGCSDCREAKVIIAAAFGLIAQPPIVQAIADGPAKGRL